MTNSSGADRPRVVAVSVSAALGGSERSLLDIATRAGAHGLDLAVLLPKEGPLATALREAGVPTAIAPAPEELLALSQRAMITPAGLLALGRGLRAWATAIERESRTLFGALPAVLYTNGFKAHLATAMVRGPRRVWHLREFPPERLGLPWRVLAGALPGAAIANSRAVADAWRLGGLAPVAIPNGVDLDRFVPAAPTGWIHDQFDLPRDAVLVGMPAVFARWKGHLEVVAAFERAAERMPGAHLVFAGGAIYDTTAERGFAEELVRRVQRTGALADRIHFVKFQPEPWRLYPEFAAVVHYSTRPEPFGRTIAEALACGVPALAAREGGPMEIVEHGVTGWLVPPRDVAALSEALVEAATARPAGCRDACRARAERLFGADRCAAEVAQVLRAAAARGAGR
jgi:glycosyltransferase involved in cell wall biosynthesis